MENLSVTAFRCEPTLNWLVVGSTQSIKDQLELHMEFGERFHI